MVSDIACSMAQILLAQDYAQTEYPVAYGLTVALILLGIIAVCIPRFRKKHFIEPEEADAKKNNRRR